MTLEQRELIEEFGLLHEQMGATRMTGRVAAWLLLCDPPEQSLTAMAAGLGVSKAAVSVAARELLQVHLVERVALPGRRGDYYRALSADPATMLPLDQIRMFRDLISRGLTTVEDREQTQSNYRILHERLEFVKFMLDEFHDILARWERRRAGATAPGTPHRITTTHPTPSAGGTT
jgi:DNA-binding transcriptional regulator GbsR (MarR family)